MLLFYIIVEKKYYRGIIITPDVKRYRYMSIKQLQDLTKELKEGAKNDPGQQAEYHDAYRVLQDKLREQERKRPRCIPTRFEHDLDIMEEF